MARALRLEIPSGRYHVTARGNERTPIFRPHREGACTLTCWWAAIIITRRWRRRWVDLANGSLRTET